ncbi:hypothetical protein M0R45_028674 [Rubus argutus]|uniref:Germin-like protein n=1 Tax=Rubus argutus TaxID=59490 RepID=A0AAW1W8H7_RUBAR
MSKWIIHKDAETAKDYKGEEPIMNGFACKDEANATAEDFFFAGLAKPGLTNNTFGSLVTAANVQKIPGLKTLRVSLARIDYSPGGINPPHTHPRATEIVFVLEGSLDVGFITTANKLISKTIVKGDVYVFPKGLVHFQKNNGKVPAAVIAGFNSQLQGTANITLTLFAATPPVSNDVLTSTFLVETKEIENMTQRALLQATDIVDSFRRPDAGYLSKRKSCVLSIFVCWWSAFLSWISRVLCLI